MKLKLLLSLSAILLFSVHALAADPDFGPNVILLDPSTADAQAQMDKLYKTQESNQFGKERFAVLLKPGKYNLNIHVGFYTHIAGLGQSPEDVQISGTVEANAGWFKGNATCNFWRSVENFTVTPTGGRGQPQIKWAVSQGVAFRHVHVKGSLSLFDGGWSSGGFLADSKIDGKVISGSQQQWFSRNCDWDSWNGSLWNMVFLGVSKPPAGAYPGRAITVVDKTPVVREKPYLAISADGQYSIRVPDLAKDTVGTNWTVKATDIPLANCYIAHEKDTAATINAALAEGKSIIVTPGIYHLEDSLKVTKADTVVLGLGYATLIPDAGTPAITIADVDGVKVSGLILESGSKLSPTLLLAGEQGASASHASNPTFLYDIFTRTGGFGPGQTTAFVTVNSNNVVCDNFWLWRADHGPGAGWTTNPCKNGLVVNGNDVTCYGLAVEHTEEYQVLWNGEGGRTYFYQSEFPYDPPSIEAWTTPGGAKGYASYKVSDKVKTHEAWGLGVYAFFHTAMTVDSAIEAPDAPGIKMHHMCTFHGTGSVTHVFNDKSGGGGNPSKLE